MTRIVNKCSLDEQYKTKAQKLLGKTETAEKIIVNVETKLINTVPFTKIDLPTSYSGKEQKLYSKIIESIFDYFRNDIDQAEKLKEKILHDIREKK